MKLWITAFASALALAVVADDLKITPDMLKKEVGAVEYLMELDGENSIVLSGTPPRKAEEANRNCYLRMSVKLPQPVDMTKRTLKMKLRSNQIKDLTGIYIRGFNTGSSKPSLSWMSSYPPAVAQSEFREITLAPGRLPGGMHWQSSVVDNAPPASIDRLQFWICTKKDMEIALSVRDIEIENESLLDGTQNFWKAVGEVDGVGRCSFSKNPVFECDTEDGMYEMEISGHSTVDAPKGKNWYEAASFTFKTPIDFRNKTLSFQIKRDSDVNLIFVRGYNKANRQAKKAEFSYMTIAKKIPTDTWTTCVLGTAPFAKDKSVTIAEDPAMVDQIEVIFSTLKPNEDFSIELRDMKIVDQPAAQ